jgi:RNA polymerase sigma-70 factor (ECF subfamily)
MNQSTDTAAIWAELHSRLLGYIDRRVGNRDDAKDVLQDVFVRIQANASKLADVESVTGWVYHITRNAIADHHRARTKTGAVRIEPVDPASVADTATATATEADEIESEAGRELARCIRPLLHRLPEPYRKAVARTDLEGASQQKAAEEAGVSLSGMKSRVQRGRAKLKEALLDCCSVELDPRRGVLDFTPNDSRGGDCDCQ